MEKDVMVAVMKRFGVEAPEQPEPLKVFRPWHDRPTGGTSLVHGSNRNFVKQQSFNLGVRERYVVGVKMPNGKRNSVLTPVVLVVDGSYLEKLKGHKELAWHYAEEIDAVRFMDSYYLNKAEAVKVAKTEMVESWEKQVADMNKTLDECKERLGMVRACLAMAKAAK